jgi:hypothetical protein
MIPVAQISSRIDDGIASASSAPRAAGRNAELANSCTIDCASFCSSVSSKEIMGLIPPIPQLDNSPASG